MRPRDWLLVQKYRWEPLVIWPKVKYSSQTKTCCSGMIQGLFRVVVGSNWRHWLFRAWKLPMRRVSHRSKYLARIKLILKWMEIIL